MADLVMGTALSETAWPAGLMTWSATDLAFSWIASPAGRDALSDAAWAAGAFCSTCDYNKKSADMSQIVQEPA